MILKQRIHKAAKKEAWKSRKSLVRSKIKNALNGAENWILIGGPPCQAYSVAGKVPDKRYTLGGFRTIVLLKTKPLNGDLD